MRPMPAPNRDVPLAAAGAVLGDATALSGRTVDESSFSALERLMRAVLAAQEEERASVAATLHDAVAQGLAASIIALDMLALRPDGADPSGIAQIRERLEWVADVVRELGQRLRPAALDLGLRAAIAAECREFSRTTAIPVRFLARADIGAVDGDVCVALFRVAQECLRNVAQHAHARRVSVTLRADRTEARLTVRDDGAGFMLAGQEPLSGGLLAAECRLRSAGGRLLVQSHPGRGTTVVARVPRQPGIPG